MRTREIVRELYEARESSIIKGVVDSHSMIPSSLALSAAARRFPTPSL